MWNKVKIVVVTVLATLGVLFIILMLIPDDKDEPVETGPAVTQVAQEDQDTAETQAAQEPQEIQEAVESEDTGVTTVDQETSQPQDDTEEITPEDQNEGIVTVNIPASEITDKKLTFTTKTLDGKKADQSIFSDYDITLVHVWGTYCGPCISEMGKYANFYETAPKNVNLVGIVCDVYDGFDNNVDEANEILSDAGAGFTNLRTSDSVYDITAEIPVIPSSFFVDREGHIIGEKMIGRGFEDTLSRLNGYLE
ncbi:MAG: redoxin family protein [Lachnospiraceae bacterium]|nr:redoxin family protein [Lachnospiraceae bacterium]